ncbi:MAG: hypothetical protein ACKVXR_14640 [Planctomycetota bacterium]
MIKALALVALLALAFAAERGLDRAAAARRAADPPIVRLVASDRLAGERVAAISIEQGSGTLLYGRKQGLWRCREAFGAVCDEAQVLALLASLKDARGVERAAGVAAEAAYGLAESERTTVRFHGPKALEDPDGDVLLAFEVGRSFAEGPNGRAFVREAGSDRILEIDRDPARPLAGGDGSIPPLVDAQFLAGSLTGEFRGFREIRIEPRGEEAMVITRDPDAPAEASSDWILERGTRRDPFPGWRVGGYVGLWLRGRFDAFESPLRPMDNGLAPPAAVVTLVPETGEPIELALSAVDLGNRARVWNRRTNVVGVVQSEIQELLAPRAELFTDTTRPNPWEAWLRKP